MEGLKYIGKKISIGTLRDFILDNGISENDTIALNRKNFDDIVLEHRKEYNVGISIPYYLLSVLIKEDTSNKVPLDRVMIIKNDERGEWVRIADMEDDSEKYEMFYRCGWCGNVVAANGSQLSHTEIERKTNAHEKYNTRTITVNGYCCPNGH